MDEGADARAPSGHPWRDLASNCAEYSLQTAPSTCEGEGTEKTEKGADTMRRDAYSCACLLRVAVSIRALMLSRLPRVSFALGPPSSSPLTTALALPAARDLQGCFPGEAYTHTNPINAVFAVGPSPMLQIVLACGFVEWGLNKGKASLALAAPRVCTGPGTERVERGVHSPTPVRVRGARFPKSDRAKQRRETVERIGAQR